MKKAFRYLFIAVAVVLMAVNGFAAFIVIRGILKCKAETITLKVEGTPQRIEKSQKLNSI